MDPDEIRKEKEGLQCQLREIDKKVEAYSESEEEMLDFVLNFSELMKEASAIYKQATTQEKQRLTKLVFTELTIFDGKLEYKATEEFEPLLNRKEMTSGSLGGAYQLKSELFGDILTVLSGLTELTAKLEILEFERRDSSSQASQREVGYVI